MLSRDRHDPPEPKRRAAPGTVEAIEEVGDFHLASDGFRAACEYYEAALKTLGTPSSAPRTAARLHRKIAECHRSRGALAEASQSLAEALDLLEGDEDAIETGVVLGCHAEVLLARGRIDQALEAAQAALEILRPSAAHREFARVQTVAAECHGRLGNQEAYEQLNLDALSTYRRIDDPEGLANVYNNLGVAYKNASRWDRAIRSLTQAREICERLGLTRRLARTLNNLGIVYTKKREFDEAITHLRRARRLVQSLGDVKTLVSVLNSLGRALLQAGRYSQAEKYLLEARVLAERHHFARSEALADEFLGDLMLAQGRLDEARENYEAGLRKARRIAPKGDVVGELLRRMADLELRSGLRSQAIATARRALRICRGCGETHEIGFIHRTLGQALQALGKLGAAEKEYHAALRAFEDTRNPYEQAWTRKALAELYVQRHEHEWLLRAAREATRALETFRRLEDDRSYCHAGLTLARAHQALGKHDDSLLTLYDVERLAEDNPEFGVLEQARALREQLETALVSGIEGQASQLNLFGELYALTDRQGDVEAGIHEVLGSLCARLQCSGAFVTLRVPGHDDPVVKGLHALDARSAVEISRWFAGSEPAMRILSHDSEFAERFPAVAERAGAVVMQPLRFEHHRLGSLYLERPRSQGPAAFSQDEIDLIGTFANLASMVLYELFREDYQSEEPEIEREGLHRALEKVITQDPGMIQVLGLIQKVAPSNCTVLLTGETGTGKGLLAHCLHEMSERRAKKFMAINCAALPEPLLESELFGHVRGAFTGADQAKIGLLEAADGGTVFLDEVGKTSLAMQGKLLQFLDSSAVRPVGSNEFRRVNVRVLCASKADLRQRVEEGAFLEDLYYRLNDFPIHIPALRERRGDVRLLVEHYLDRYAAEVNKRIPRLSRQAVQLLESYAWPGNVRELEKCIKRAVILADDGQPITARHLPDVVKAADGNPDEAAQPALPEGLTLREHVSRLEARLVDYAIRKTAGNKSEAARLLGISYPSFLQKFKQYTTTGDAGLE